ncbi:hypothetical protein [Thermosulfurimonas sp. F29]|uniref:hypothetical protein n=1 Tax=Thermosulfurimonas sp. F29 TaxID=2867247 RepID=UPI001C830FB2|nr:hypothetical protein [Thermosulfurimonas sp. F29]MBX6423377.1 hypothetical protein [Thermosulfurimonas sp. F29]
MAGRLTEIVGCLEHQGFLLIVIAHRTSAIVRPLSFSPGPAMGPGFFKAAIFNLPCLLGLMTGMKKTPT